MIARVGESSLHPRWLADAADRNWDLQLVSYAAEGRYADDGDLPLTLDRGAKFDGIYRYLAANPAVFTRYERICLPDDDVLIDGNSISRLFATCAEFDLDLAQPSQTFDSHYEHAITLQSPSFRLRYTNFVEGQWPCFRASYLHRVLPLIEDKHSGWGIDLVWGMLMEQPRRRCAIVDEVAMTHTRPHIGDLYATLDRLGVDALRELAAVEAAYPDLPRQPLVYGGVLRSGRAVGATRARLGNGANMIRHSRATRRRRFTFVRGLQTLATVATRGHRGPRPLTKASPA